MVREAGPTLRHVADTSNGARHAILIDPADQTPEMAAKRCVAAVSAGSRMVLVGGSTGTDMMNVHNTVVAIKEALELITWASSQDSDLDEESWGGTNVNLTAGEAAL